MLQERFSAQFEGLCASISKHLQIWEDFCICEDPLTTPLPLGFEEKLAETPFLRMIMLKILRPEKLLFAFMEYVYK